MPALATSSTGHPVAPESHWSVSALPAPRAISTSPSGWKRTRPPIGATPTGAESGTPSRLVRRSISRTSTRTFCAIASRSRCRRLRRSVASDSLPPSPKFQASRGSRARAARRISGSVANGRGNSFDWAMAQYYTPVRPAESWYTARRAHPSEPREDLVMEMGCHLPTTQAAEAMGEALVTFAREAERQHIASLCVSDHVVIPRVSSGYGRGGSFPHPPERPYLEAVTALAAAAVCTRRARLGSSVFILGHRHPGLMAKMLASIDALSNGRLICGVGVGWWKEELEILGTLFNARGRRGDEALRVFKELWTSASPRFEGEALSFRDIGFAPRPVQKPHPPIWIGGASPAAFRRVVTLGDGWHASPRSVAQFREGLAQLRVAAATHGRAWETLEISLRFGLSDELVAQGKQAVIDQPCEYKRLGVRHTLVEFRRPDLGRMMELLGLVAE